MNGGNGSAPGGGGGAGGLFYFLLRDFYSPSKYPNNTISWEDGDPEILGGHLAIGNGGTIFSGEDGLGGFIQGTPCYKGYEFHICQKCDIGFYKDNPSSYTCNICLNLPSHANYNTTGWSNPACPY